MTRVGEEPDCSWDWTRPIWSTLLAGSSTGSEDTGGSGAAVAEALVWSSWLVLAGELVTDAAQRPFCLCRFQNQICS